MAIESAPESMREASTYVHGGTTRVAISMRPSDMTRYTTRRFQCSAWGQAISAAKQNNVAIFCRWGLHEVAWLQVDARLKRE